MKLPVLAVSCLFSLTLASFGHEQGPSVTPEARATKTAAGEQSLSAAEVRALMKAMGTAEMGKEMMDRMMRNFEKMGRALPRGYIAKFRALAKPEELMKLVVPIYRKHLDAETCASAMRFFRSDAGRKWVAANKRIARDSQVAGEKWGKSLSMRAMRSLRRR